MKPEKFLACVFVSVIMFFMISLPVKFVISRVSGSESEEKILSEKLSSRKINIDWEELYPFTSSDFTPPLSPVNYLVRTDALI